MSHYVQLVVDVDGYQPENKTRIVEAVNSILDWTKVRLGKTRGHLKFEGLLSYDLYDLGEALAETIHQAIVGANDGFDVYTKSWFYDLEEPFSTIELGRVKETGTSR